MFSSKKFKSVELVEPSVLKITNDNDKIDYYVPQKDALRYIYYMLGMTYRESKILYKADKDSWKQYIISRANREDIEIPFDLSKCYMIFDDNVLISVSDEDLSYDIEKYYKMLSDNDIYSYDNGIIKAHINGTELCDTYIEINLVDGIYKVLYTIINDNIKVMISPMIVFREFKDFIRYDIQYDININTALYGTSSFNYSRLSNNLSYRELFDIIKILKLKKMAVLDSNGILIGFRDTDEYVESLILSQPEFHKIPYKSMAKMKYLEKSLTITTIKISDMLGIMDKYFQYKNITIDLMEYLFYGVYYCEGDVEVKKSKIKS